MPQFSILTSQNSCHVRCGPECDLLQCDINLYFLFVCLEIKIYVVQFAMPEMVAERCDIQHTSKEIRFNFCASCIAELIFQLFKYDFFICIFVMDRILSPHGIFEPAVTKKNTEVVICLAMKNMSCLFIPSDRVMFENIFSSFYSKIYLQQNCVIECYDGGDGSTPALYFLIPWIQNLA